MNTNAQYAKIDNHKYNNCDDGDNIGDNVFDVTITDHDHDHDHAAASPYSLLPTDEDREAIINDALDELADVARENILEFKREDFDTEETVRTWIDSYLCDYFAEFAVPLRSNFSTTTAAEADALNDVLEAYILDLYNEITERFYDEIAPPRVSPSIHTAIDTSLMNAKIRALQEKPQPDQRTPEWYERRNNLITASAASKAFGTQASVNQLVYEKCKNQAEAKMAATAAEGTSPNQSPSAPLQGSVNSPLHWGQRYEPVTVMVYEHRNKTTLGEFGCIQHETYPFIGASPDGINIDANSPIYGRMVEIKNIVNREITGQPKEEYWIQTQIQMEVCDLDECDFVETRFKEYENKEDYESDGTTKEGYTAKGNEKGVILWFQTAPVLTQSGHIATPTQLYEYAPIGATPYEYDKWEAEMFIKHERLGSIWVRTIYWYLDEYSCVLVRRNRLWFDEAAKVLARVWAMIEEERETGYEHRAPMKRRTAAATTGTESELKIIKLECAIVPTTNNSNDELTQNGNEATATNMATLMAINNHNISNKKYSGTRSKGKGNGNGNGNGNRHATKGPSEVLISCFKIDDLEIDESKVE
jgi:putative phage-type endonuclease